LYFGMNIEFIIMRLEANLNWRRSRKEMHYQKSRERCDTNDNWWY
jgi:hypothetical protein